MPDLLELAAVVLDEACGEPRLALVGVDVERLRALSSPEQRGELEAGIRSAPAEGDEAEPACSLLETGADRSGSPRQSRIGSDRTSCAQFGRSPSRPRARSAQAPRPQAASTAPRTVAFGPP